MEDKIRALQEREVDMVMFTAANQVPDSKLVSVLNATPFYYTVRKGNQALLAEQNVNPAVLQHLYSLRPVALHIFALPAVDFRQSLNIILAVSCNIALFVKIQQLINAAGNLRFNGAGFFLDEIQENGKQVKD